MYQAERYLETARKLRELAALEKPELRDKLLGLAAEYEAMAEKRLQNGSR